MRSPTPTPGALVWLRQRRWRVERARVERNVVRLDVTHDRQQLTVLAPFDRPALLAASTRPRRVRRHEALARLAGLCGAAFGVRDLRAAQAARIDLLAYQLEPALAALDGQRRMLVADAVGLGKTIQAGLVLAELACRNPSLRALIVTPAGLRAQWRHELHACFSLDLQSAEHDLPLADRGPTHRTSPWLRPGLWMASVDYVKQPHVLDAMPLTAWDVVVIDEAHVVAGQSNRYEACDELGRRARCLILLSATPHTGDEQRFRRLVQLGSLPHPSDTLEVFRRTKHTLARPDTRAVRWHRLAPTVDLVQLLDALRQFERVLLLRARASRRDAALLLLSVFRKRAVSSVKALDRSLARRLEWLDSQAGHGPSFPFPQQPRFQFDDDDEDAEAAWMLAADVGLPAAHERTWLRRLRALAQTAARRDPKVEWLKRLTARTTEPLVVFTEFRDTLEVVQRALAAHRSVAVLHGGQSDAVRQRELARFLDADASVLVSTDAGGQGLNLQSRARWVVVVDLPWNPTRLEQRIGRVDRIGQPRRVHATMLLTAHAVEDPLLATLARRTVAARRAFGDAVPAGCAPPTPLALAAALFDGTAIPARQALAHTLSPSTHRIRTARAMARLLRRRRVLLARWRGPHDPCGRLVALRHPHDAVAPQLRIFSVPVVDRCGGLAACYVVALRTSADAPTVRAPDAGDHTLADMACRHVRARVDRLARVLAASIDRRIAIERGVALHLHALQYPEEAQLGLFSRREAQAFHQARHHAALSAADAASHIEADLARTQLEPLAPRLAWLGRLP